MSLISSLRDIGLHKSEIVVYLFLLRNGVSTVKNVSHGTKIARTNCYHVIRQLLQKGLISKQMVGNKVAFAATELNSINDFISSKSKIVKTIWSDLESIYFRGSLKPQISFITTDIEAKSFFSDLISKDNVLIFGPKPGDPEPVRLFYDEAKQQNHPGFVFIHPRKNVSCYFIVWDDKVAIIPISVNVHITIIQNYDISSSFSAIFS